MAARIPEEAVGKMKERFDALSAAATGEIAAAKESIRLLTELKPAQAGITVLQKTIDNLAEFVRKQAEITRKWVR